MNRVEQKSAILRALEVRQSRGKVRKDPVPREIVEQIIEAASWAPNHYRTEPWRFIVLTGDARKRLGEVMATSLADRLGNAESDEVKMLLQNARNKPLRAPVIVAVAAVPSDRPKVTEIEEIEATAAAVQNMLLAAEALGLGAMWRTGAPAYDPAVKEFLGLPPDAHIVSLVYLGFPEPMALPERTRDARKYTTWMDGER